MARIYKNEEGKKLYPVCGFLKHQHKILNAYDKAIIAKDEEIQTRLMNGSRQ